MNKSVLLGTTAAITGYINTRCAPSKISDMSDQEYFTKRDGSWTQPRKLRTVYPYQLKEPNHD